MFASTVVADVLSAVGLGLVGIRLELFLFAVALVSYLVLFKRVVPSPSKKVQGKGAGGKTGDLGRSSVSRQQFKATPEFDSGDSDEVTQGFQIAFEQGDDRAVLQFWSKLKMCEDAPAVPLANVVESMQRLKKDTPVIIRELKAYFKRYPSECNAGVVSDVLESLSKRLDSELMEQIMAMLPSFDMQADPRMYEILLNTYFTLRNFTEVKALVAEMKREKVPITVRAGIVVMKTALKMNNFDEALTCFRELRCEWQDSTSESTSQRHLLSQLVELACKEHRLASFLPELEGMPLTEGIVHMLLTECARQTDTSLTQRVEEFAHKHGVTFSDQSYGLLVRGYSGDPSRVNALLNELLARGVGVTPDFALAVISVCSQTADVAMADKIYEHLKDKKLNVLSALVRFYAEHEEHEKACAVYEKDLTNSAFMDPRLERTLMTAALRSGRSQLAESLLGVSPSDLAKYITMIRNCAAEKNLAGAKAVFESAKQSQAEMNSVIYNTVLDACVACQDIKAAEEWMEYAKQEDMIDVVSFNTLIKAHLQLGNFARVQALMEKMKKEGLQPNEVTYNELINAMVTKGGERSRTDVWGVVAEMHEANVKPNQVTCSILLKCLNAHSDEKNITRTMDLINTIDESMDEVLLSSVIEACIRIGKPELLSATLHRLHGSSRISVTGSHTFGSLIKAYGHSQDIDGVWRCWKEMRSRHIRPTSITIGCMVEAVVNNGDAEGAYELIHQMQDDDQCRESLNAVIYCSVLKGFAREKKLERVWQVYEEMSRKKLEVSIVTFNTVIDACARCGRMDQVASIEEDMRSNSIKPNVITYSTMMKGYCQMGDIQTGFAILKRMKEAGDARPDEIMYNSLLDGCAQNNLVDEGCALLQEMQRDGVKPSNYTLSILVKMMSRARKLDGAFAIVEDISRKYQIRPNVHVYANLILSCICNRSLKRGMQTLEQMANDGVQPDSRTYSMLIRACIQGGLQEEAAGLLRAALGLPEPIPILSRFRATAVHLDSNFVNESIGGLAESGRGHGLAASLLSDLRKHNPRIRVDADTQRRVKSPGAQAPRLVPSFGGGKGSAGKGSAAAPWRNARAAR